MKPTKNKIFCPAIRRTKMLFEEERKALNFIKFNRDTILEETGYAPSRAYYCPFCLGWHVTSNEDPALGKILDKRYEGIVEEVTKTEAEEIESEVIKEQFRERLFHSVAWALLGNWNRYNTGISICEDQIGMIRVKTPRSNLLHTLTELLVFGKSIAHETARQAERTTEELSLEKEDMSLGKLDRICRKNALVVVEFKELLSKEKTAERYAVCVKLTSKWQGRHQDALCRGLRDALKELFPASCQGS